MVEDNRTRSDDGNGEHAGAESSRQPVQTDRSNRGRNPPDSPTNGDDSILPGGLQWTPVTVLLAVVLVGGVAVSGAFVVTGGDVPFLGDSSSLGSVPDGVDVVVSVDSRIVDDRATETLVNGYLGSNGENAMMSGPSSLSGVMDAIENETAIDIGKFESALLFAKYPEQSVSSTEYGGIIVQSDWSETEFVANIQQNGQQLNEQSYRDTTVYVGAGPTDAKTWIAPLGDGAFALGNKQAVTDVIDVRNGDMSAMDGDLTDAYDSLRDGYVKFASTVPDAASEQTGGFSQAGRVVQNAETTSGVYYTRGGDVGMELRITNTDQSTAKSGKEAIEGTVTLSKEFVGGELTDVIDAIEITRTGRTVTVGFEYSAEALVNLKGELTSVLELLSKSMGLTLPSS